MNFWEIGATLLSGLAVVAVGFVVVLIISALVVRKMVNPLNQIDPQQVQDMLSKSPTLTFDLTPIVAPPIVPEVVNGFTALGYNSWRAFEATKAPGLSVLIATHPNGTVCAVYQAAVMGVWFEVYAPTATTTYLWTSNPLFDHTAPPDIVVNHHRLLPIHTVEEEIAVLNLQVLAPADPVRYLQTQHRKNEIHRLGQPLNSANVAALLAHHKADSQTVEQVHATAQAARWEYLEEMAWEAVGADPSGESFVVHPYSVVSEDIHVLVEDLRAEGVWPHPWEETSDQVPNNFVSNLLQALPHSSNYTLLKTAQEPLSVAQVQRTT